MASSTIALASTPTEFQRPSESTSSTVCCSSRCSFPSHPKYYNHAHTAHDTFVIFGLSTIYIVFSILLTVRTHSYDDQHRPTFAQKMTFLQVVVISFFNAVAAGIYIYMQNVRISDAIIIAGTYAWLLAHGTPPFVYLLLNKTIRTDFMLCLKLLTHGGHSNSRVFVLTASGTAANNRQQMLAQHHHGHGVRFASQQPNQLAPIEVTSRAITEF